jgi:hypothetical protein
MYLRHTTVTKNGKSHTYWRLVRSVRTGNRVRQQTVAQLGELDTAGRVLTCAVAKASSVLPVFSVSQARPSRSRSTSAAFAWNAIGALATFG